MKSMETAPIEPVPAKPAPADGDQALLRKRALEGRRALSDAERKEKSARILEQLCRLPEYRRAQSVLCYVSFGHEVSTRELIDRSLSLKKRVFCPRVEGERMRFYRIFSRDDLSQGFRSVLEPDGRSQVYREAPDTLIVVPGTVFDRYGQRIGYGGGYYDRFLAGPWEGEAPPATVGICFACQLAERVPTRPCDVPVGRVLFA